MNKIDKTFGLAIRLRRQELEFSQEDLAFKSGLHRTYVSQLERGIKSPSLRVIMVLADALQTNAYLLIQSAESLLENDEEK